jgi:hypothetical protein
MQTFDYHPVPIHLLKTSVRGRTGAGQLALQLLQDDLSLLRTAKGKWSEPVILVMEESCATSGSHSIGRGHTGRNL